MSDYDGVVWTVADPDRDPDAAQFVPVDTQLPELDEPLPEGTTTVEHTVEIRDLGGTFLPAAGIARRLTFGRRPRPTDEPRHRHRRPPRRRHRRADLRQSRRPSSPPSPRTSWRRRSITPVDRTEELELLPPPVRNLAADLVEGRDRGWDQMAAIRDEFVDRGFYDVTDDTAPGHSYGRIAAMLEDPERIVGFEEQYAAAAAVMAQVAELPVRVVVGYVIPPDAWQDGRAEVTASDISAWVEIDAGELGWIPVDVTPDRSRTPDPDSQGSTTEQVAIPNPPPPPPPPPQIEPPRQEEDEIDSDDEVEPVEHEFAADTGLAPWAVDRRRRGRRADPAAGAVRPRRHRAGSWLRRPGAAAGRRPPPGSPARGPRPSTAAPRPARPGCAGTTPHETVGVYAADGRARHRRAGAAPAGRPGRPGRVRRRPAEPTSTPTSPGRAATSSPPSCAAGAGRGAALRMLLDPRPLLRDRRDDPAHRRDAGGLDE